MSQSLDVQRKKWTLRLTGLRIRLLLLLFITLLPVYGFILYYAVEIRQQAEDNARRDVLSLTRLIALEQKKFIEFSQQQLLNLAQLPIVRDHQGATLCNSTFIDLLRQNPLYSNLGVISLDGTLRCTAITPKNHVNLGDRDYFQEAIRTRDFSIGAYQIGRVTHKISTNLAYPVLDATNTINGVVFIELDLGALAKKLIETTKTTRGMTLTIVNDRGIVLARQPDPEKWGGKSLSNSRMLQHILAYQQEETTQTIGIDGVERLYAFKPIYSTVEQQVYLLSGIPTEVAYAEANKFLFHATLLIILITVAVVLLAWVGGKILVLRPMNALMDATHRLGQGDLNTRTHLAYTADEFGRLAQSFDRMAEALETRQAEIARAEAEAELLRSRAMFENLFKSLPGLYLVLTPDLKIFAVSDAYLKATMTKREEIIGHELFEIFPDNPDDTSATGTANLRASLERVRQSANTDSMPIQKYDIRRPDGTFETRYWSPINSPVLGIDHQLEYIIHRVEDVTAFVQQKSHPTNETIEMHTRMEQMEAEIFQSTQKIQAANQQLNAANQELEAFSYSVSHDLRAPLRSIDGFSQALLEDYTEQLDEQGKDYLNRVRNATQRMGHLIDDMLTLSRVTRTQMQHGTVDLSTLANEVIQELQSDEPTRKVDIHIEPGLSADGDAQLLRVVLTNLLGNAWKFTSKTECATITFSAIRHPNDKTEFFVRDNGAGFDMRYAQKLFGAFQRLHLLSDFAGTGVGLATVQRIVHRHGGKIRGEGIPGQGATFFFTLSS